MMMVDAQVIGSMPPSSLAGAILGSDTNPGDVAVVERLEWVRQWVGETAAGDADPECCMLAAACCGLQVRSSALELYRCLDIAMERDDALPKLK